MKCSMAQEQISSLVGGEGTGWRARQAARHCAHCPACQLRREQAAQITTGLRGLASLPTPPHVRANVFAQLPTTLAQANAAQNMQVSLGLEPGAKRRRVARRLVGGCGVLALSGTALLLAIPYIFPGEPSVFAATRDNYRRWQERKAAERSFFVPQSPTRLLAKCRTLRDLWKPWALEHATPLRQMLRGDKQGSAAMMQVFEEMPGELPNEGDGLTYQTLQADGLQFSWTPAVKQSMTFRYNPQSPRNPASNKRPARSGQSYPFSYGSYVPALQSNGNGMENWAEIEKQVLHKLKAEYQHDHDLVLSTSTGFGRVGYSLWTSGRITETTWKGSAEISREISPPYEELTR